MQILSNSHYDETGGPPAQFIKIDPSLLRKIIEIVNLDLQDFALFKVDIDNDGRPELVVIQQRVDAKESAGVGRDIIGPVFREKDKKPFRISLPSFPTSYTNTLRPQFSKGLQGLQMNLTRIIGFYGPKTFKIKKHPFDFGETGIQYRQDKVFIWKNRKIRQLSLKHTCDTERCGKNVVEKLQKNNPAIFNKF